MNVEIHIEKMPDIGRDQEFWDTKFNYYIWSPVMWMVMWPRFGHKTIKSSLVLTSLA